MSAFSPGDAAFEGFRVIRREPRAVFDWVATTVLALIAIGAVEFASGNAPKDAVHLRGPNRSALATFGPLAALAIPTLLLLWSMTTAAVYRAVLRPGEHGRRLFKIGRDEARILMVTALGLGLVLSFGAIPAYFLFFLFKPFLGGDPEIRVFLIDAGALITVLVDFWIVMRLWLMAAQTFAEGRFHLIKYWTLTRGYFWTLSLSWIVVALLTVVAFFVVGFAVYGLVLLATSINLFHGPDLFRRAALWTIVILVAVFSAGVFVVSSILVSACQAYAYRSIAAVRTS